MPGATEAGCQKKKPLNGEETKGKTACREENVIRDKKGD